MKKDIRYSWIGQAYGDYTTIFRDRAGEKYNFIFDHQNPDYIFANHEIFISSDLMQKLVDYKKKKEKAVYIFIAIECLSPDMNIFDYAISFDDDFKLDDRYARILTIETAGYSPCGIDDKVENPIQSLSEKTKFCNFIYSNSNAHPTRDELFHKISEYKKVDSLGAHLSNCEKHHSRLATDWQQTSIELKQPYKFSIASENASYKGYTSEKIMTSFIAHSIPIYWGNPNITRDFNPKSFINCHDYPNLDAVLARIKEIDNDDDLWLEIMSQPRRTESQINLYADDKNKFDVFVRNIFEQDIQNAQRAPTGCWPEIYKDRLFHYYVTPYKKYKPILGGLIKKSKDGSKRKVILFNFIKFSYTSKKRNKALNITAKTLE